MTASAEHRHVLLQTHREGSFRGLWHCSQRHRLQRGQVIEFGESPPRVTPVWCMSGSSCSIEAGIVSFEKDTGCFVMAAMGSALGRTPGEGCCRGVCPGSSNVVDVVVWVEPSDVVVPLLPLWLLLIFECDKVEVPLIPPPPPPPLPTLDNDMFAGLIALLLC